VYGVSSLAKATTQVVRLQLKGNHVSLQSTRQRKVMHKSENAMKLLSEDDVPISCAAHAAVMPNCDSTNFGANTTKPLTSKPSNNTDNMNEQLSAFQRIQRNLIGTRILTGN